MRRLNITILMLLLIAGFALISPGNCYSIITHVELYAPAEAKVNEEIAVQADIHTGNNLVESVHNVSAILMLPPSVQVISGFNPLFIGEMGPGPVNASCYWKVEFGEPGEYLLWVNASCINTQNVPQWVNASTTVQVYALPHVEFMYTPTSNVHVNDNVIFDASKSYARGPDAQIANYSWDFGDGTGALTDVPIAQHEFLRIGNFTVLLNVTDNKGSYASNTTEIAVGLLGDINSDGRVDIKDIAIVAYSYDSRLGDFRWNEECDLNNDGIINIIDIATVAEEYGKIV
jgi:hypothetical protein